MWKMALKTEFGTSFRTNGRLVSVYKWLKKQTTLALEYQDKNQIELQIFIIVQTCSYMYGLVIQFNFDRHSLSPMLNALIPGKLHLRRSPSSIYLRTVSIRLLSFGSTRSATGPWSWEEQNKTVSKHTQANELMTHKHKSSFTYTRSFHLYKSRGEIFIHSCRATLLNIQTNWQILRANFRRDNLWKWGFTVIET